VGEEGPRDWTIQFEDGKEVRHTDFYPIAGGPNCFMESNLHQLCLKVFQNIKRQIPSPQLLGRIYPARSPEIPRQIVVVDLDELV